MPNQGTIPLMNDLVRKGFGGDDSLLPGEGALYQIDYETQGGTSTTAIPLASTSNAVLNLPYEADIIFDVIPLGYFAQHASRAWSTGGNFRLRFQINSDVILFNDEEQIEESDANCENPEQNILVGAGPIGPFFVESGKNPRFTIGKVDQPTVITTCSNGPYRVSFYVRCSNLFNEDITINSGAFSGINVTLLEDYNPKILSEVLVDEQGNTNAETFINTPEEVLVDEQGNTSVSIN